MSDPISNAWEALNSLPQRSLAELFAREGDRVKALSGRIEWDAEEGSAGILFDWSKTHLDRAEIGRQRRHVLPTLEEIGHPLREDGTFAGRLLHRVAELGGMGRGQADLRPIRVDLRGGDRRVVRHEPHRAIVEVGLGSFQVSQAWRSTRSVIPRGPAVLLEASVQHPVDRRGSPRRR